MSWLQVIGELVDIANGVMKDFDAPSDTLMELVSYRVKAKMQALSLEDYERLAQYSNYVHNQIVAGLAPTTLHIIVASLIAHIMGEIEYGKEGFAKEVAAQKALQGQGKSGSDEQG